MGGSTSGILTACGHPAADETPPGRCAGLFQVTGVARPKRKGGRACQKRPRLKASNLFIKARVGLFQAVLQGQNGKMGNVATKIGTR